MEPGAGGRVEADRALIFGAYERAREAVEVLAAVDGDLVRLERWLTIARDRIVSLGTVLGCELGGVR